jgi:hypothetical protein
MIAGKIARARPPRHRAALLVIVLFLLLSCGFCSDALAAGTPALSLRQVALPTTFSPGDAFSCQTQGKCDSYQLLVTNVGNEPSNGPLTITDRLPAGIALWEAAISGVLRGIEWECTEVEAESRWVITCEYPEAVPAGTYAPPITLRVTAPPPRTAGPLINEAALSGGEASEVVTTGATPVAAHTSSFDFTRFELVPSAADGAPSADAGGHPWELTTTFQIPSVFAPPHLENSYQPTQNVDRVSTELPLGLVGNPQATARCSLADLTAGACSGAAQVGTFAVIGGALETGAFQFTGSGGGCCSAIFNLVPEAGYPAEFGFTFAGQEVILYASVVHGAGGYQLRVGSPGILALLETHYAALTFFGNPGALSETGSERPFLTNPASCSGDPLSGRIEANSWEEQDSTISREATAYPSLTGCNALQFHPTRALQPDTTSADAPAGLDVDLQVPQTSGFEELATPPLKTATVQLPEGLVVNPSAASGLEGCEPTGPQGINIGSESIGAKGQDLGDPEATELGAGHPGGNGSPYDDGYYHVAPGHCPPASTLGTVVAETPLLDHPIKGQIFLGTPECAPCSSADAESGKLLKLYLEINDPKTGTILKLPGSVSANAGTGRLTATFAENPQLPFSDLKLHFKTGPRAALTSPQTCGTYSTTSSLEPWSAPETPTAVSNSSFDLSSGPQGCGPPPNKPHFEAGTTSTQAGAYAPFVLKLSREDGTQRLKALDVALPPGLTGKLAGVQECSNAAITAAEGKGGKAEQASPSCPLASELGTVSVGAGSGPNPYFVQGHAYLAGPYKGAPLSMAIITPAVAGPFDLGTVVVRAALFVNEETAQITVESDPIPQIRAGIPLDVRSIAVNISRNQFTLNPTSCDPMTLAASVVADASTAAVSSPFQVGGCSALAFKPKVALSLKGGTRRHTFPALKAVVTYPPGPGYANIARAQVTLPHSEFLEQGHIRTVCTRVQFAAGAGNGSGCPAASVYGFARAVTPLLDKPLEGPVYLRSSSHKLPDLVAALNGQIDIALAGRVDTGKNGGIRNTFEVVPDAPVTKFTLEMQGGKKGLLVNSEDICGPQAKTHALVHLVSQNGKVLDLKPKIANSCGKNGKKSKGKGKKKVSEQVGSSHR